MHKCIDAPRANQLVYDECISIAGWLFAEGRSPAACRVRAWLDGAPIGETQLRLCTSGYLRLYVSAARCAYRIPFSSARGWRQRGIARSHDPADRVVEWRCRRILNWKSARAPRSAFLQNRHFGEVVFPAQSRVLHRENIYGSGPPVLEPGRRDVASHPRLICRPAVPSLTSDAEQAPTVQPSSVRGINGAA